MTRITRPPLRRCALYTRKSSEEGLDQDFNSLDAQRDACAAYVKSQSSEGWKALPGLYDDGGHSGGTMERPALQRLLADICAGRVDIVVVYKIDRLTRSLADFARMVEIFERHEVSFVSVTQSFNTTSSMGRLTLNMLLSFAQFEREITGERIRDKIEASKKKGLWMGGNLPLGYDLPIEGSRVLVVNPTESDLVRQIFTSYLKLGSVHVLERHLRRAGIVSKVRTTAAGRRVGGKPFSRGALFHLLRNRLYLGEIPHRDTTYPGQHAAIVDPDLFGAVQSSLDANARRRRRSRDRTAASPLVGRIFDIDGQPMSPTFAHGRNRRLYRYYVSANLQQGRSRDARDGRAPAPRRISAEVLEAMLDQSLSRLLPDARDAPCPASPASKYTGNISTLLCPCACFEPSARTCLRGNRRARSCRSHPPAPHPARAPAHALRKERDRRRRAQCAKARSGPDPGASQRASDAPHRRRWIADHRCSTHFALSTSPHTARVPSPRSPARHPRRPSTARHDPRGPDGFGIAPVLVRATADLRIASRVLKGITTIVRVPVMASDQP